jgi:DNA gyrase/topoisomerase IV subunit A
MKPARLYSRPDFPTGGVIVENKTSPAYRTGKGGFVCGVKYEVEDLGPPRQVIITEIPYQVQNRG